MKYEMEILILLGDISGDQTAALFWLAMRTTHDIYFITGNVMHDLQWVVAVVD